MPNSQDPAVSQAVMDAVFKQDFQQNAVFVGLKSIIENGDSPELNQLIVDLARNSVSVVVGGAGTGGG